MEKSQKPKKVSDKPNIFWATKRESENYFLAAGKVVSIPRDYLEGR